MSSIKKIDEIRRIIKEYPRFEDGRVDYTNERICFALNCVVIWGDQLLLTERGADVIAYPGAISGVSGFIDDLTISIEDTARNELAEEAQAPIDDITTLIVGEKIVQTDSDLGREWHVYPVLVEFKNMFDPVIFWENKSIFWHDLHKVQELPLMPGYSDILAAAIKLR